LDTLQLPKDVFFPSTFARGVLEIVKTYENPRLIYDFPISLRHELSKTTSTHILMLLNATEMIDST